MKASLIILLILLIAACNNEDKAPDQKGSAPENETLVVKQEIQVNEEEPNSDEVIIDEAEKPFDFTYNDLDGNEIKLSDYRGKWVVVNFWATWCAPCRKEIPDFVKFKSLYSNNVEILGIDYEDTEIETIRKFVDDYSVNYPILMADVYNPTEFERQNTMGLPTTVIFDPQGVQFNKRVGPMHFKDLVEIIDIEPNNPITEN